MLARGIGAYCLVNRFLQSINYFFEHYLLLNNQIQFLLKFLCQIRARNQLQVRNEVLGLLVIEFIEPLAHAELLVVFVPELAVQLLGQGLVRIDVVFFVACTLFSRYVLLTTVEEVAFLFVNLAEITPITPIPHLSHPYIMYLVPKGAQSAVY